jgi:AraC-like DNA-binding protein
MNMVTDKRIKFWRVPDLRNLELLSARQERSFPRRMHDRFEISVIESGAERLWYRGNTYTASAGSVVVVSPGEAHAAEATDETGWSYRAFYPSAADVQDAAAEAVEGRISPPSFSSPVIHDEYLSRIIRELHLLLELPNSALALETHARWAAFHLVSRHANNPPAVAAAGNEHRAVRLAREFIQQHYQENVSLVQLARLTGLSPFRLVRTFTKQVGLPPHAYLNQVRVNRAKQLLANGQPAALVAYETGFADQSHLTRHFKRLSGLTPGQYSMRQEHSRHLPDQTHKL